MRHSSAYKLALDLTDCRCEFINMMQPILKDGFFQCYLDEHLITCFIKRPYWKSRWHYLVQVSCCGNTNECELGVFVSEDLHQKLLIHFSKIADQLYQYIDETYKARYIMWSQVVSNSYDYIAALDLQSTDLEIIMDHLQDNDSYFLRVHLENLVFDFHVNNVNGYSYGDTPSISWEDLIQVVCSSDQTLNTSCGNITKVPDEWHIKLVDELSCHSAALRQKISDAYQSACDLWNLAVQRSQIYEKMFPMKCNEFLTLNEFTVKRKLVCGLSYGDLWKELTMIQGDDETLHKGRGTTHITVLTEECHHKILKVHNR